MFNKFIKYILSKIDPEYRKFLAIQDFLSPHYQQINVARLQHLESLDLQLKNKSVIEFGAGIGDHTIFYLLKNCTVLPIEGRESLAKFLSRRFGVEVKIIDLEKQLDKLHNIKRHFDVAHCYGLLYHLSNPENFISTISKNSDILLLETCVANPNESLIHSDINNVNENRSMTSQSILGIGCRPDRKWLFNTLKKYYKFVYMPKTQPKHEQFPTNWNNIQQKGLVRSIFIASKNIIDSDKLSDRVVTNYESW